jgi:hypothetical protein
MKISLSTATAVAALAVAAVGTTASRDAQPLAAATPAMGHAPSSHQQANLVGTVNVAGLATGPRTTSAQGIRYSIELDHHDVSAALRPTAALGGANAPGAKVVSGGGNASGFNGINILEMEGAGTGQYAGTQFGLEPPDQALCVGNGYVMEGVNTAWRIYSQSGAPLIPAVPLTQFFKITPAGGATGASFVSDPRCEYDPQSGRFFALMLEADEASGGTQIPFTRSHSYFAVSKTGDPTGDWWIYSIDVTDDGQQGTPMHSSCPCIDDQPLMGLDKYGFYLSGNQFSDSEIFPVAVPGQVYQVLGTLPDYRNGQAQVYAMSKQSLLKGTMPDVLRFDTGDGTAYPIPAQDQGKSPLSIWSSLQPASPPPGDRSPAVPGGAEYLMSQLDFQGNGDNRIAIWALTNTASLDTASPKVTLQNDIITTLSAADTYKGPFFGVDQKVGPHPLGDQCGCPEEQIAANDDRMNKPMYTNGILWAGLNTELPPAGSSGQAADKRAGIMYFAVKPGIGADGKLTASMQREGYVQVPGNNALFPSIAASARGPVAMFFSISGMDYFPSAAWTRLDGLQAGQSPEVHISGPGTAPEDGFTGYPTGNQLGVPVDTPDGSGVARWGDYTYAAVDEHGCLWGSSEYIPNEARDASAGNWGTFITRVASTGCSEPAFVHKLNVNVCGPAFTDPAGDEDELGGTADPVTSPGQTPQLDILAGDVRVSSDRKTVTTTLTLKDLSTAAPAGGQGNDYFVSWYFDGVTYRTHAFVDAVTGALTVEDSANGTTRTAGPADTGSLVTGPNGKVIVNVPASAVGNPQVGDQLLGPSAETREAEGQVNGVVSTLDFLYDSAGPKYDVLVGARCTGVNSVVTGMSGPINQPGSGSNNGGHAGIGLPNTAADSGRSLSVASAAGVALLLGVRAAARRRRRTRSGSRAA